MKKQLRWINCAAVVWLVGCAATAPVPVDRTDASRPAWPDAPTAAADQRVYPVDASVSQLRVRVAPAGSLARLGHHHVIGGAVLSGRVIDGGDPARTAIDLAIDVPSLLVDRPEWRREAGFDPIDSDAVDGTRRNLLGPEVLDAERHPRIELRSVAVSELDDGFDVTARVRLRGAVTEVRVPVSVERTPEKLVATGAFGIEQTALGMTPFSAAGGALRVADRIEIEFTIVATRPAMSDSGSAGG